MRIIFFTYIILIIEYHFEEKDNYELSNTLYDIISGYNLTDFNLTTLSNDTMFETAKWSVTPAFRGPSTVNIGYGYMTVEDSRRGILMHGIGRNIKEVKDKKGIEITEAFNNSKLIEKYDDYDDLNFSDIEIDYLKKMC